MNRAILLLSCQDQQGITAHVTNFVFKEGGNILHADQHKDEQKSVFFMRVEWDLKDFKLSIAEAKSKFQIIADQFQMNWSLETTDRKLNVALFVSKKLHCLNDLLYRYKAQELDCHIPLIISNHEDARALVESYDIPYYVVPITKDNKFAQEKIELDLLKQANIDLVVLARYHQILTDSFIQHYPNQIINIHHSFLPAFAGANPYGQAYAKGVKIIGATSHYVIEELDQGPIIEQDTVRISHRDSIKDVVEKGQDLEKVVFYRAIRWHLQRRVLSYDNKTVVFN